ncbi:DNA/RNA polymerase [Epithele typhae]|uniref:DNA/RNA polymerase n=1 Tax=Epithele typhae TaxID=378194 RepID=UPI002008D0F3|nr:DNA/RNA polymerase [Epithele typhae]KAH9925646.1 DNA/RNA polymerase [Epithele typhae]
MIPLSRRNVATRAASYTRQSLPRPARLYSTPSQRLNAPAEVFSASSTPPPEYPAYLPSPSAVPSTASSADLHRDLDAFLKTRPSYTVLPNPSVEPGVHPELYPDGDTQHSVAIIDACLSEYTDVPRAKAIFERLQSSTTGAAILNSAVYNRLLGAYVEMAIKRDQFNVENWLADARALYLEMEKSGASKIVPTPHTYATMLRAWVCDQRAGPRRRRSEDELPDPGSLMDAFLARRIAPTLVVSDRVFVDNEEAQEAITALSRAAVEKGHSAVISELGLAQELGKQYEDPRENVPDVIPVTRKVSIKVARNPDGSISQVVSEEPLPQSEVPFNINILRRHLSQTILARRVLATDAATRQRMLEQSTYSIAAERMKHQAETLGGLGLQQGLNRNDLRTWMWEWHQKLRERLKGEIDNLVVEERVLGESKTKRSHKAEEGSLSPFLRLISAEKLSLITILEIMQLYNTGGVQDGMKTARALLHIGRAIEMEYKAEIAKKSAIPVVVASASPVRGNLFSTQGYQDLYTRRMQVRQYNEESEDWSSEWTAIVRIKLGSFLLDSLMDVATVQRTAKDSRTGETCTEEHPAFYHTYEYVRGQKLGILKFNPAVAARMATEPVADSLHPRYLPMVTKPKPWTAPNVGGYLESRSYIMRFKDSREQANYVQAAAEDGRMEYIYIALDALGGTPWRINKDVFNIVLQVWNSGERFEKIPPAIPDEPMPEPPANYEVDQSARTVHQRRMKRWQQNVAENHSDRCSINYKVEIARAFLGDTFYQPHNLDFRGRAYPMPPHLNHLGDDLCRGLLLFEKGKRLGERGLRWLKVHLANVFGYDKASFDERVAFVHEHLEDVFDSADHPLDGKQWWRKADDPWQCLSTCMEVAKAMRSPVPEDYVCALPVHQDGTCNGLQHYAALGGDPEGAAQVNLAAGDRPSDVYTYVARMVEDQMDKDIERGSEIAKLLQGKITRKVVKQTVMTTVYGVTFVGAREQIERQLEARGDIPAELVWDASSYLAKLVLGSIGNLFKGAKDIQSWLTMSARMIAKSIPEDRLEKLKTDKTAEWKQDQMTCVAWTTALGLPIVQPYRALRKRQVLTKMQTVYIADPNMSSVVNSTKQAAAFPPNFIHSLDATHMMLTALACAEKGIEFASVHDSYWTHACDIDNMSALIRDTFISLHSSGILERLAEEWKSRYATHKVPISSLPVSYIKSMSPELRQRYGLEAVDLERRTAVEEAAAANDAGDEDAGAEDANIDAEVEKPKKRKPRRKNSPNLSDLAGVESDKFNNAFIDLNDLIPPLPEKGQFDVGSIKESQYFFS